MYNETEEKINYYRNLYTYKRNIFINTAYFHHVRLLIFCPPYRTLHHSILVPFIMQVKVG